MVKTPDDLTPAETKEVTVFCLKVLTELRQKIKHTAQILKTESPAKIAHAILDGDDPPNLSFEKVRQRARLLLQIKKKEGVWRLEDKPRSSPPVSVLTPHNIGRIKKMGKKSVRKIEVYTDKKSPGCIIKKSTAHLARKKNISN